MSNDYYNSGSWPATGAAGASAPARAELTSITAGFAKLPTLTANGSKAVIVNAGATALGVTTGTLALAGNFATTGAYNTTLVQQASTTVTLPTTNSVMARIDAAQTFTGVQTLSSQPILSSLTASLPVFSDGSKGLVSNAMTGTGNVVMSASPTLTGTVSLEEATASGLITANAGVAFPAVAVPVADVNTLDDYEEQDWTPTLASGTCSGTAHYTKIGRQVTLFGSITHTGDGAGTTAVTINNLPFVAAYTANGHATATGIALDGADTYMAGVIAASGATMTFNSYPSGGGMDASRWLAGAAINFNITYFT